MKKNEDFKMKSEQALALLPLLFSDESNEIVQAIGTKALTEFYDKKRAGVNPLRVVDLGPNVKDRVNRFLLADKTPEENHQLAAEAITFIILNIAHRVIKEDHQTPGKVETEALEALVASLQKAGLMPRDDDESGPSVTDPFPE